MPHKTQLFSDPESRVVGFTPAVVYAPGGRRRKRFPENCVQLCPSEEAARAGADPAAHRYAAMVAGPSRSSEGFRLYYLVEWL